MGSLYNPNTKDAEGNPLVYKRGADAGKLRVNYFFALAVPKTTPRWQDTPWGKQISDLGNQCFPGVALSPSFAWKIDDGDSQIPNKKGRKPCDNEGWPGNWILKLSGGFAPKVYRMEGNDCILEQTKDYAKCGHYVEVAFSVDGNGSPQQPGMYLNTQMVCWRAFGPEISTGRDVSEAGFGASPLPAGATTAPVAAMPTAPLPIVPKPDFLMPKPKVMTALAGGATYDAFIAQGWTDEQLIAQGFMQP